MFLFLTSSCSFISPSTVLSPLSVSWIHFHPPSLSPARSRPAHQALNELTIRGEIRTTVEYLRKLIELDDFKANRVNTGWLESVMAASSVRADKPDPLVVVRFLLSLSSARDFAISRDIETMSFFQRPHNKTHRLYFCRY